jgi:hypothetical protein
MVKYAILVFVFILTVGGAYYLGYRVGSSDTRVEYITKEIEVVRYVDKKKSDIYSKPNASRDTLLELMRSNKL